MRLQPKWTIYKNYIYEEKFSNVALKWEQIRSQFDYCKKWRGQSIV